MKNDTNNRSVQLAVLILSIIVIAAGFYDLLTGDIKDLFRVSRPYNARHMPLIVFFLAAIPMAYFSAKNLRRKK